MNAFAETAQKLFISNGLVTAFLLVGSISFFACWVSRRLTKGLIHGSAIAILLGLGLAYAGGIFASGPKGLADIPLFAGVGFLGGSMMRDFTIVSTAYGADIRELKRSGLAGVLALVFGVLLSFVLGSATAVLFGFSSPADITTIGAGAVTFIAGPVTGTAIGAGSDVIAISIAAGVVKSIAVMTMTPFVSRFIRIDTPKTAMIYGGLMGTTSGTAAGMAATNPELVPYAAMTATFYTGFGCLICPSILYWIVLQLF
jgi:malonate transporter MadM subunit